MLTNCDYKSSLFIPNKKKQIDYNKLHVTNASIYSITPYKWSELICKHIKKYYNTFKNKQIYILDGTSCVGGDTICFSMYFTHIYATEKDTFTYNCLNHNIKMYEQNNITTYNLDFLNFSNNITEKIAKITEKINVVYLDPEWGGTSYRDIDKLSLFLGNINVVIIINSISNNIELYPNIDLVLLKIPKNYNIQDTQNYETTTKYETIKFPKFDVLKFDIATYRKFKYTDVKSLQFYRISDLYKNGNKNLLQNILQKHCNKNKHDVNEWLKKKCAENTNDIELLVDIRQFIEKIIITPNYEIKSKMQYRVISRTNDIKKILKDKFDNEEFKNTKNFKYLDFGCGKADITAGIKILFNIKKNQVIAADKKMWIENENIKQLNVTKLVLDENYTKINLLDNSIDVITCFQSLHHVLDIELVLKEFTRITKKNGYLIIREHDCDCLFTKFLIDIEHWIFEISLNNNSYKKCLEFYTNYKAYYKSRFDWTQLMYKYGFKYCKEIKYPEVKNINNPSRYYYAAYKKQ